MDSSIGRKMSKKMVALALIALLFLGISAPGCVRGMGRFIVGAIVLGTAIAVLAHHDAHFHSHHCGHRRVHDNGRDIYHYKGHWEYYDPDTRRWYYYY